MVKMTISELFFFIYVTVPKKLSSHVVVKAPLKAIPQNHYKTEKNPTLRTSILGCPHLHTGFLGVTLSTQAYLHEQHFIFMWHPRLLQETELECDRKFLFSNKKVLIMWQCMCYWEYCFKVDSFCQNLFDWLHKFAQI